MTFSARTLFVVLAVLSVFAFGMTASPQTPAPQIPIPNTPKNVISGSDIGFRVERMQGNKIVGRLVVRINGEWIEAQSPVGVVPLGSKD